MDGIVTSVVRSGFFVSVGAMEAFVSRAVSTDDGMSLFDSLVILTI